MFERDARGVLDDVAQRWLDMTLATNPAAGVVIPGAGGVRKIRIALEGRGKRGGARVIYYYSGVRQRVFLLAVYAKNERSNLAGAQRTQMRRIVASLED